jgi:hypothetical protein
MSELYSAIRGDKDVEAQESEKQANMIMRNIEYYQ